MLSLIPSPFRRPDCEGPCLSCLTRTALPITSARRFCPSGPGGICILGNESAYPPPQVLTLGRTSGRAENRVEFDMVSLAARCRVRHMTNESLAGSVPGKKPLIAIVAGVNQQ